MTWRAARAYGLGLRLLSFTMERIMPTFTVTIAGPERHDGEAPYTYVIEAVDLHAAVIMTQNHHQVEQEVTDTLVLEVFEGVPSANCGYVWNDLRKPGRIKVTALPQKLAAHGSRED